MLVAMTWDAQSFSQDFAIGQSAEDIAAELWLGFVRSPKELGWRPKKGSLYAVLRRRANRG